MDDLFADQSNSIDKWLDSVDESQSEENLDPFDSICRPKTTTIEKVLNVSPIKSSNPDNSYVYDFEEELSFDKSKSSRKYFKSRRAMDSMVFSPKIKSTPKPPKSRKRSIGTALKKSYKRKMSDISLWDKAMQKSPELKQWVNSFNEDMKKIESSELNVSKMSIDSNHSQHIY